MEDKIDRSKKMGKETEKVGTRLTELVRKEFPELEIHFHHGGPGAKAVMPKLKGNHQNSRSLYRNLAKVDIGIIDPMKKTVVMLIEIEEHKVSPKAIIGDICNIFFADAVQLGGDRKTSYDLNGAVFVLALTKNFSDIERQKAIEGSIAEVIQPDRRKGIQVDIVSVKDEDLINKISSMVIEVCTQRRH
jgi:hypothetical protein